MRLLALNPPRSFDAGGDIPLGIRRATVNGFTASCRRGKQDGSHETANATAQILMRLPSRHKLEICAAKTTNYAQVVNRRYQVIV